MSELQLIEVEDVTVDETVQVRDKTYTETVNRYAYAIIAYGAEDDPVAQGFPPIEVEEYQRDGARKGYWLVGGFHRIAAAKRTGKSRIWANVSAERTLEERQWKAAHDNLTHGRNLSRKERVSAFKAYIAAGQHREQGPRGGRKNQPFKTIAQMQRDLGGMKYETLRKWMWKYANPTYKQVFQGDGSSLEDDDKQEEWQLDPEDLKERRDLHEANKAIDLLRGLVRSLRYNTSQWHVKGRLEEITHEIDERAGKHPQDF